ncbi:hypothetical protein HQQ81_16740 [Microbacteriaceae bacterium VKM Ac-2854]|nr:hypothetical protein [Microbacteriaceae bacterium VKM Ac-2854]
MSAEDSSAGHTSAVDTSAVDTSAGHTSAGHTSERPILRVLGRGFTVGAVAVGLAAVIAYGLGFELGILVLIGALGFFTAGIGLSAVAGPGRRPLRSRPSWTPVRLTGTAIGSALLVPLLYTAGMAYGASWLEWDPQLGTHFYNERPGGFIVIIAALTACVTAGAVAIASAAAAMVGFARRRSRRSRRAVVDR